MIVLEKQLKLFAPFVESTTRGLIPVLKPFTICCQLLAGIQELSPMFNIYTGEQSDKIVEGITKKNLAF